MQQQMERNALDEVNWDHRQHTRSANQTGFQTAGIISDTASALGAGADWTLGLPGDTLKGLGNLTDNAWDWGIGGTANATADTWDWAVGGTGAATDTVWDWAAGGTADATGDAMGGGGNQQEEPGSGMSTNTMMMIGGVTILGIGGAYLMTQR